MWFKLGVGVVFISSPAFIDVAAETQAIIVHLAGVVDSYVVDSQHQEIPGDEEVLAHQPGSYCVAVDHHAVDLVGSEVDMQKVGDFCQLEGYLGQSGVASCVFQGDETDVNCVADTSTSDPVPSVDSSFLAKGFVGISVEGFVALVEGEIVNNFSHIFNVGGFFRVIFESIYDQIVLGNLVGVVHIEGSEVGVEYLVESKGKGIRQSNQISKIPLPVFEDPFSMEFISPSFSKKQPLSQINVIIFEFLVYVIKLCF